MSCAGRARPTSAEEARHVLLAPGRTHDRDELAGFPDDWANLVNQAINSDVCNPPGDGGRCKPLGP